MAAAFQDNVDQRRRRVYLAVLLAALFASWLVWGGGGDVAVQPGRRGGPSPHSASAVTEAPGASERERPAGGEDSGRSAAADPTGGEQATGGGGGSSAAGAQQRRGGAGKTPFLQPEWGYNKKRNHARWAFIHKEIAMDGVGDRKLSLVDYGSDEGYFSISVAHAFPRSVVMGVELGGVGGSIWMKKGSMDVLQTQERKIREFGVQPRVVICQTGVAPKHFFALRKEGLRHDYQFVLSVFHWFSMPDRTSFEEVLVAMLGNARTTFIELPIVGDRGPRFAKQVGWANFLKWYDGRSDIGQVLRDSLRAQGVDGEVRLVGSVKWYPADPKKGETKDWMREVYRVDIPRRPEYDQPGVPWDCDAHFRVYGCNETTSPQPVRYAKCPERG
eukprot:TRINITY_DN625_c0_g1_i1.p1 TRINITY_DN625_c0_g1~~TRINITY_DN625_c0_g1_i1.p1  ORF type:complete len:411 (+),score=107.23 TRINITY_DN625_c0_g1_i1:74-1234(+)